MVNHRSGSNHVPMMGSIWSQPAASTAASDKSPAAIGISAPSHQRQLIQLVGYIKIIKTFDNLEIITILKVIIIKKELREEASNDDVDG